MKKKILFINDYLYGGGAEVVFNSTYKFFRNDYECSLFYGTEKQSSPKSFHSYIFSKEFKNKLQLELNRFKPDIIHIHNFYHLLSPSILMAIREFKLIYPKLQVIMTLHDYHLICPNSGYSSYSIISKTMRPIIKKINNFSRFFRLWDRRGILFSTLKLIQWIVAYRFFKLHEVFDLFISPSMFLKNEFKKYLDKKIIIVRNFFSKSEISIIERTSNKIEMVFIGRISKEKGLFEFITALTQINDIPYSLDIIGDGDQLSTLKKIVNNNSMQNEITFHGRLPHDECMKFLQNVNTLVLPSLWYENAPLSLVEGSLAGLRLLTMNAGGMKEISQLCGNEYLIEFDYSNFRSNLIQLLSDINNNKYNENDELLKTFSQENYISNLRNIYDNIL